MLKNSRSGFDNFFLPYTKYDSGQSHKVKLIMPVNELDSRVFYLKTRFFLRASGDGQGS